MANEPGNKKAPSGLAANGAKEGHRAGLERRKSRRAAKHYNKASRARRLTDTPHNGREIPTLADQLIRVAAWMAWPAIDQSMIRQIGPARAANVAEIVSIPSQLISMVGRSRGLIPTWFPIQ